MKFSEMPYVRPDVEALTAQYGEVEAALEGARTAEDCFAAIDRFNALEGGVSTMGTLAYVRHTIDTRDEYYDKENEFIDETMPLLQELSQKVTRAMLRSPFRPALEEKYGKLLFTNLEIAARHGINTVSRLPLDPAIARQCDLGLAGEIDGPWLEDVLGAVRAR